MSDRILKESDVIREVESLLVSDEMRHLNDLEYGNNQALYHVIDRIEDLPSADRPQGKWIYCEDEYGIDGYRCSNCGRHIPWDYQHKFINFIDDYHTCPFCDARMKGADDE